MQDPGRYDNNKSPASKDTDDFLPAMIDSMNWDQNETILDYGCGPGGVTWKYFAPLASKYNSTVYAVDISDNMIQYAQKKYPHPLVHYMQGDVQEEESPLQDMQFNHIFSIYVFHFIKDYRKALRRFHEMLTPGGDIGFIVLGKHQVFAVLERVANDPKWAPYMKNYREYLPEWQETNKPVEECFKQAMFDVGYDNISKKNVSEKETKSSFVAPSITTKQAVDPVEHFARGGERIYFVEGYIKQLYVTTWLPLSTKEIKTHIRTYKHNFDAMIELYFSLNPFLKQIPEELTSSLKKDYRRHIAEMHNVDESVEFITAEHEMTVGQASKGDINENSNLNVNLNLSLS